MQLSTGYLYLDALASPATALLGHDLPELPSSNTPEIERKLNSLAPGYVCVAMAADFASAAEMGASLGRAAAGADGLVVETNASQGEPETGTGVLVAHENETIGRNGQWFSSLGWRRIPDVIVVGEALALGSPFGAVLAREELCGLDEFASSAPRLAGVPSVAALERVHAAVATVENDGLLQQGRAVADYLVARLAVVRESCEQIAGIAGAGLTIRVSFSPPTTAAEIRRKMCERGVLVGVAGEGNSARLVIDPPLPLRIAEADVITGALRGAVLDLPMVGASVCCPACERAG